MPFCSMGSWLKLSPASKRASRAQLLAARARRPRIVIGKKQCEKLRQRIMNLENAEKLDELLALTIAP